MRTEEVTIRSSDGLKLQGVVDEPDDVRGAFVLCHPHPKMGGTMNAPLLVALRDRLVSDGWGVVRFNFRGIGASEGEASTGEKEVADAKGAVALAKDRWPDVPLVIGGWSFGAAVAIRTMDAHPEIKAGVAIAPAVKPREGITAGLPDPSRVSLDAPVLFVAAVNDHLVELDDCRAWIERVPRAEIAELEGANHFFWAKYDDLVDVVASWLADNV
ncbi:MAG: alpha/beta fold hydrolase [Actinomycetota bacterium]|nr:alpha/beta fold hydrolase [Actinomycetota bacterium]